MRPAFKILADGADVTGMIADRLVNLEITDRAGVKSDRISIRLDDRDDAIAMPRHGVTLEAYLGFAGGLNLMGKYAVDGVEHVGPPNELVIAGRAADMRATLKERKTRPWDQATIGAMVDAIAAEHGFSPAVDPTLGAVAITHIDQTDESDMHLLTRLARDHDAVFKPAGGRLIFAPKGQAKSVTGKQLPAVTISGKDIVSHSFKKEDRGRYVAVEAAYHAIGKAERVKVKVGEGKPVMRLPGTFPDLDSAMAAAKGKRDALDRGAATMSLTLHGLPTLAAECRLIVVNHTSKTDGEWSVTAVTQRLDKRGGLTTTVEMETPKGSPKSILK